MHHPAQPVLHPWQQVTVGSGLMLHAPLSVTADPVPLQREFAALDAEWPADQRLMLADDGSWSSICLVERRLQGSDGCFREGVATPALQTMPSARRLLEALGCRVLGCDLHRQAPGGFLRWHFDNQALHLPEARLIVPVLAPPGALTLIGDGAAAYPPGVVWTGDFTFPHQVENAPESQRIVLLVDIASDDHARSLAPAALSSDVARRYDLSQRAMTAFQYRSMAPA
ncbi:aspartyl/asparaginyl beta-hydroxylase domain-containing protein [Azospirillum sp. TSO35-2]|uniref:aspartyl/asparaginyl beta-hydroxylase domain-containing protein n=1 Tax=Azospirillum sp. TSO35-2 TaxID=716796 RepID=UPI000D61371B|nr:aspartyl/asparaginyl beta-hydroxylase domain-containing protein [Azospirillum sp. TSO35-2]PWC32378.1 hypothetical protein TSO352_16890 [Azospirillum sp. TSO35-2]